jgi:hypothetical protein
MVATTVVQGMVHDTRRLRVSPTLRGSQFALEEAMQWNRFMWPIWWRWPCGWAW